MYLCSFTAVLAIEYRPGDTRGMETQGNVAMHDFANSRGGRVKVKLEHESQLVKRDRRICSILYIGAMTKLNLLGKN